MIGRFQLVNLSGSRQSDRTNYPGVTNELKDTAWSQRADVAVIRSAATCSHAAEAP